MEAKTPLEGPIERKLERATSKAKEAIKSSSEKWLAKNRSLVLRQTPIWAQSLTGIVISLGLIGVGAG